MFKNIRIFRLQAGWTPSKSSLETALAKYLFQSLGATQKESVGWSSPKAEPHSPLIESVNGQWMLKLITESASRFQLAR